jgi:hypothetical protein
VQPSKAAPTWLFAVLSGAPNLLAAQMHVPDAGMAPLLAFVAEQSGIQSETCDEPAAEVPPKVHAVGTSTEALLAAEPPALYLFASAALIVA